MLFKDISIFNSGGHFVQQSGAVWTILFVGITSNIKFFCEIEYVPVVKEILFKDISIFRAGGHFIRLTTTVCEILVEGIMGNIHVKLF